jgi:FlaA1/EpsC-like NDP-sugar epimerase
VLMLLARGLWRTAQGSEAKRRHTGGMPTLVFGAGEAGRQLITSMLHSERSPYKPVGLLDDDPWKRLRRLDNVSVLGTRRDLAAVVEQTGAEVIVIAVPSASTDLIREVSGDALALGLAVKVVPAVEELLSDHVDISDVRDIDVRDLLGRQPIDIDIPAIAGYLNGKRVLVTGAGGSIGSELCRQISRWGPAELIMLDRDESALHALQLSLTGRAMLDSRDVVLNDIRDKAAVRRIFRERRPEVVFHAAALKHLPMLEQYPAEALKTNVLGTAHVLAAAAEVSVERFVNISTDKAASPASVLGFSKRVAERLTADVARTATGSYLSVRFGNVLGSRGSVLTTFAAQIAAGGPVTVTDPNVTRYFMTVEEAVQLVVQAAAVGRDGEVLILDMGNPVRIEDVARQLIKLSGRSIDIAYTGLRQGEKLHEQLFSVGESVRRPHHPLISHVDAPALPMAAVQAAPETLDDDGDVIAMRMQAWCEPALPVGHGSWGLHG